MLKPATLQDEFQFEVYKETLEELGFSNKDSDSRAVVVAMDARGNPYKSSTYATPFKSYFAIYTFVDDLC